MTNVNLGDIDPVGLAEIAAAVGVEPDTAKKWRERHDDFPKPAGTVSGRDAWRWGDVRRWLVATKRLPQTIRYRDHGGGFPLYVEILDGDDQWQAVALISDIGVGDYRAQPTRLGVEMSADADEAQAWADRLLAGWDKARADWVAAHPDEEMPPHLIGG